MHFRYVTSNNGMTFYRYMHFTFQIPERAVYLIYIDNRLHAAPKGSQKSISQSQTSRPGEYISATTGGMVLSCKIDTKHLAHGKDMLPFSFTPIFAAFRHPSKGRPVLTTCKSKN